MPRKPVTAADAAPPPPARERILKAAATLFYLEGIRAVSVDAIAEKAGLTKKTLYYHFASKDDLIAAYIAARDLPNLKAFQSWFDATQGALPARIEALFGGIARAARHPKWKGCGFLRTVAELANLPGHPARKVGAEHKKRVEDWLASIFAAEGIASPEALARHVMLLVDGAFSAMLVHRDPGYGESAGAAARVLVEAALQVSGQKNRIATTATPVTRISSGSPSGQ